MATDEEWFSVAVILEEEMKTKQGLIPQNLIGFNMFREEQKQ